MADSDDLKTFMEKKPLTSTEKNPENSKIATFATTASWIVNWFLLIAKAICLAFSSSKSVTAALADSAVDLLSQFVLSAAEHMMNKHSPDYPIGRSKLEALSVLACASIMTVASVEVIQFSIQDIIDGFSGDIPALDVGVIVYVILGGGIIMKVVLYVYCRWAQTVLSLDGLAALAEDHLNDVFSNTAAIITASIAYNIKVVWWVDPVGAIAISLVIIYRWIGIMSEQIRKITGHTAPLEFLEEVSNMATNHSPNVKVDGIRAYHFGTKYIVELEILLPSDMTVGEAHSISFSLQHRLEEMENVERAFVHVDHQERSVMRHRVERQLLKQEVAEETFTYSMFTNQQGGMGSSNKGTLVSANNDNNIVKNYDDDNSLAKKV